MASAWSLAETRNPSCNISCAQWCATSFAPTPEANCTSLAALGTGPCYVCGPRSTNPHEKLCEGACSDTSSDSKHCGTCGNVVCFKRMRCLHRNCSQIPVQRRFNLLIKRLCLHQFWPASLQRAMPGLDFRQQQLWGLWALGTYLHRRNISV